MTLRHLLVLGLYAHGAVSACWTHAAFASDAPLPSPIDSDLPLPWDVELIVNSEQLISVNLKSGRCLVLGVGSTQWTASSVILETIASDWRGGIGGRSARYLPRGTFVGAHVPPPGAVYETQTYDYFRQLAVGTAEAPTADDSVLRALALTVCPLAGLPAAGWPVRLQTATRAERPVLVRYLLEGALGDDQSRRHLNCDADDLLRAGARCERSGPECDDFVDLALGR